MYWHPTRYFLFLLILSRGILLSTWAMMQRATSIMDFLFHWKLRFYKFLKLFKRIDMSCKGYLCLILPFEARLMSLLREVVVLSAGKLWGENKLAGVPECTCSCLKSCVGQLFLLRNQQINTLLVFRLFQNIYLICIVIKKHFAVIISCKTAVSSTFGIFIWWIIDVVGCLLLFLVGEAGRLLNKGVATWSHVVSHLLQSAMYLDILCVYMSLNIYIYIYCWYITILLKWYLFLIEWL